MKATEIGLGLLGYGTVGKGIHDLLAANGKEIEQRRGVRLTIRKIAVRELSNHLEVEQSLLSTNPLAVVNDPSCQLVAEVMGGEEPALQCISAAIASKRPTATANKLVVAKHWPTLIELARQNNVGFRYESAVCAGIPILSSIKVGLAGNHIESITGIVNGTTNFILTRMREANLEFEEALSEAKDLGYAEADPSSDVDGWDAAYKLSILASVSTNRWLDPDLIKRQSIRGISRSTIQAASALGCQVKLAARFSNAREATLAKVEPVFAMPSHALFAVDGTENIVQISASPVGRLQFRGSGAGAGTTASGVVSDLIQLAIELKDGRPCIPNPVIGEIQPSRKSEAESSFAVITSDESGSNRTAIERLLRPIQIVNSHTFVGGAVFVTECCSQEIFLERIAAASEDISEFYEVLK
jgi:homoserine dehydrogenase